LIGAVAVPAYAVEFDRVIAERSAVSFGYKQMGVAAEGRFKRHSAQLSFDPARPESGRARVEIELASVDTGFAEGDEELRSKGWFHTAQYPKAIFVSTAVKGAGANRYEVAGKLTIKGITRDIVVPATFAVQGGGGQFEGAFFVKRLDFKIGEGVWSDLETVANEVQVRFRIAVAPAAAVK
jgi:polyisoprenoid-binding protein YceI